MTTMAQAQGNDGRGSVGAGGLFGHALAGGAIAAVINVGLLLGASAAGVSFQGEFQPGQVGPLPLPAVVMASIVPGLAGALVALGFRKLFAANAARNFAILAAAFAVFSLGGPANVKQLGTGALVVMELMHVVAALGIGGALVRALRK